MEHHDPALLRPLRGFGQQPAAPAQPRPKAAPTAAPAAASSLLRPVGALRSPAATPPPAYVPAPDAPTPPARRRRSAAAPTDEPAPLPPVPPAPAQLCLDPEALPAADAFASPDDFRDPLEGLEAFAPDLFAEPEDDPADDDGEDAVPTADMPLPASVPLYDLDLPTPRRKAAPVIIGVVLLLAAAAYALWHFKLWPFA